MDEFNNLLITSQKPFSQLSRKEGFSNFKDLSKYVKQLPYQRISNNNNYALVLIEKRGTCSSKHAFLKQVALENDFDVTLHIGIYKMYEKNTNGVGPILKKHHLSYLPEAHCYLKYNDGIIDCTKESSNLESFHHSLLIEETILPNQTSDYKIQMHKAFLKNWITEHSISLENDKLWQIREQCIAAIK